MKISIVDDYLNVSLKLADWSTLPSDIEIKQYTDHITDEDALVNRLKDSDIIVAHRERTQWTGSLLKRLPKLKLLIAGSLHSRAVDWRAAEDLSITVCGTDSHGDSVIEMTWGLIFAVMRYIPEEDRLIREGRWMTRIGRTLSGNVLGVAGLGRLGAKMAALGNAFNMKVIAWSQNLTPERAEECGATAVSKEEFFKQSDVITVMLAMSERSRGIIGAKEFSLMKPTAYIVNTARGPIIDENAMVAALTSGAIAGAGLDVFDVEPLPTGHPLLSTPNTVLSPHNGSSSEYKWKHYYTSVIENILAWLDGNPIRVRCDPGKNLESLRFFNQGQAIRVIEGP